MELKFEIDKKAFIEISNLFRNDEKVNYEKIVHIKNVNKISKRDLSLIRFWLGIQSVESTDGKRYWVLKKNSAERKKLYGMEQQNQQ